MKILVNGQVVNLKEEKNILDWAQEQNAGLENAIIEYNGEIIPQEKWVEITLQANDRLEVFKFVGGG